MLRDSRRAWLEQSAALTVAAGATQFAGASAAEPPSQIIDTHTHFFDPMRPEGVPWPGKNDAVLYRQTLPKHFREVAGPHSVTGTIVVEASPWLEDNQWLLDLAKDEPVIVGIVGHLNPGDPEFAAHLRRFAKSPLFRGIRVNQGALAKGLESGSFVDDLKRLADADLALDVNGGPDFLPLVPKIAEKVSDLRIVINHCANLKIDGQPAPAEWLANMRRAAEHKHVWCKVSALVEGAGRGGEKAPGDLAFYRPALDALWTTWGADRLIYGSNWPVCGRFGTYAQVFDLAAGYFREKGKEAADKFLAQNSRAAYKWSR